MKAKCKWGDSVREIMRNNKRGEKGRKRKREERKSLGVADVLNLIIVTI